MAVVNATSDSQRIAWIDAARGIAIMIVVFAHVVGGLPPERFGLATGEYRITAYFTASFLMAFFFGVSGMLAGLHAPSGPKSFARSTFVGLIVPYVEWSVLFSLARSIAALFAADYLNHPADLTVLSRLLWDPHSHFWFLYVLILARTIYYVAGLGNGRLILPVVGVFCSLYLFLLYHKPEASFFPEHWWPEQFYTAGVFYGAGLFLVRNKLLSRLEAHWSVTAALGAAWFAFALLLYFGTINPIWQAAAATLGATCMLQLCWRLPDKAPITRLLGFIGVTAIAIYVSHPIFSAGMRAALLSVGISNVTIHVIAGTFMGVAVPIALYVVAGRLRLLPYIGFGRNPGKPRPAPQPVIGITGAPGTQR